MAHARRKFHEARKTDHARSVQALAYIRLLYDLERQAQEHWIAQKDSKRPVNHGSSQLGMGMEAGAVV